MAEASNKNRIATIVAVGGLIVSFLVYLQARQKNLNDRDTATRQIRVLQQQLYHAAKEAEAARKEQQAECEKRRPEHDNALRAMHQYDEELTKLQGELTLEQDSDNAKILRSDIEATRYSRDNAANRVQQLEKGCSF